MGDSAVSEQTKPSKLRPSEICFSQKQVYHRFRRRSGHGHCTIGETLDNIVEGRTHMTSIPTICIKHEEEEMAGETEGSQKKCRWITADNRRLWIFRHLERLGRCKEISFEETTYINPMKLSSENRGASVEIKNGEEPGGYWHEAPDVTNIDPMSVKFTKNIIPMSFSGEGHSGVKVLTLVEELQCGASDFQSVQSIVVWDDALTKRVIDGNRRLWAFQKAEQSQIAAIVITDRQFLYKMMPRMISKSPIELTSGYDLREVTTEF